MQNTRQYFLFVILAACVAFWAIVQLATPRDVPQIKPVDRLIPQMFLVVIAEKNSANSNIVLRGTGILIDQAAGNLVTAKHVLGLLRNMHPEYAAYALIDGVRYPLELSWEHPTEDIAIARFQPGNRPRALPQHYAIGKDLPQYGARAKLIGYLGQETRSGLRACERIVKTFVCEKSVPLTVELVGVSMVTIILDGPLEESQVSQEAAEKGPGSVYLTALFSESGRGKTYTGMSGGALVSQAGELVAIFTSFSNDRALFIVAKEIPEEFLPHSSP